MGLLNPSMYLAMAFSACARVCQASGHISSDLMVLKVEPSYVKGYVKRGKTDQADAEAICEAVTRTSMRFVP